MKRLTLTLLFAGALLVGQNRSAYGPSRIWWDAGQGGFLSRGEDYDNPDGTTGMVNLSGRVSAEGHPFFEALGTNGRACITCHQPSNSMSVSTDAIRKRWLETEGKDPIFAAVDGSDCPNLPQANPSSHSLLLNRGVFRIAMSWPPLGVKPDFKIEVIDDPTGCNRNSWVISVYRRPRVVANLAGERTLMADGRDANLRNQAMAAAMTHEQMQSHPDDRQLAQILEFEKQIFVAQSSDIRGGRLTEPGAPDFLGPDALAEGRVAITDAKWLAGPGPPVAGIQKEFRESAARGSVLFIHKAFKTGVMKTQTCASCHNEKASLQAMEIGTTNHPCPESATDLPLFRVTCDSGTVIYTQDPGRALVTGKCADTGAIVPQQLRALAGRAPYFASGSAKTLAEVVEFYDRRYSIGYTPQEKQDLVNFLKSL